jgi:hypothetical protein
MIPGRLALIGEWMRQPDAKSFLDHTLQAAQTRGNSAE